jgi:hypothetical protein
VLERRPQTAIRLPSHDELMGIVFELEKRLSADTTQAREELRRIFRDGKIALLPQPDGRDASAPAVRHRPGAAEETNMGQTPS